ncbi:diacylglycerol/lipid kinase family protein [Luteimicrobium subarcticum]|uniref:diacylglycerol/lipid kinase family protein n=1 Tax=Luteimicrobium subarcticum TaxID=620910 RepID=UPI001FE9E3AA|nr:diacylglycerol kinase family protein [Luteimicrobium subarcticum]
MPTTPPTPAPRQSVQDDDAVSRRRDLHVDAPPASVAVVLNPNRLSDPDALRSRIAERLSDAGWPEPVWLETTADDPGTGQARQAAEDGTEVVLVCGGDGTVRAAVEGLVGTGTALGILPGGTGNLLAGNLDIPTDLDDALDVALSGDRCRIDVGEVDGMSFVVMAGIGLDAAIMDDAPTRLKNAAGPVAYVVSALKHLFDDGLHVEVVVDDGEPLRRHARTVVVGNVGRLQGSLDLLPDAEPDSGVLEVAVLAPRTLWHWLRLLVGVALRRRHVREREVLRGSHVVVRAHRPERRQVDGDVIESSATLDVTVRPGALTVCVPCGCETS